MTSHDVLQIVYRTLAYAGSEEKINDVTMDIGVDSQEQVILTTDDGKEKQVWIFDEKSILESDSPFED